MANQNYAALPPTPQMAAVGLSFSDVLDYARHGIHLLQTVGSDVVDLLEAGFKGWKAAAGRDFAGVFAAILEGKDDVMKIIAAIKTEFGLE